MGKKGMRPSAPEQQLQAKHERSESAKEAKRREKPTSSAAAIGAVPVLLAKRDRELVEAVLAQPAPSPAPVSTAAPALRSKEISAVDPALNDTLRERFLEQQQRPHHTVLTLKRTLSDIYRALNPLPPHS